MARPRDFNDILAELPDTTQSNARWKRKRKTPRAIRDVSPESKGNELFDIMLIISLQDVKPRSLKA